MMTAYTYIQLSNTAYIILDTTETGKKLQEGHS